MDKVESTEDVRPLRTDELDTINGGVSAFDVLLDAFNNAIKAIGDLLSAMARKG